ncbi:Hypothetical predicted protein [Marmota monax]|uniref:Uncharacterized protein n=1 Tax=Marmota monax TaxID=9995 RepID=A0A5E4CIA0_MARMO|nr:Hypothetical predicted protein [Marmota monax]
MPVCLSNYPPTSSSGVDGVYRSEGPGREEEPSSERLRSVPLELLRSGPAPEEPSTGEAVLLPPCADMSVDRTTLERVYSLRQVQHPTPLVGPVPTVRVEATGPHKPRRSTARPRSGA